MSDLWVGDPAHKPQVGDGAPHAKTVAVDFDGVLSTYTGWKGIDVLDDPEPGALQFVEGLLHRGYRVVVMSSRARYVAGKEAIINWLLEHGFPPLPVTHEKVLACAYVDDRAVNYKTGSGAWGPVAMHVDLLAEQSSRLDSK